MALRFLDTAGQHYVLAGGGPPEFYIARKWTNNQSAVTNNGSGRRGMPFLFGGSMETLTQGTRWILGGAFQLAQGSNANFHQLQNNGQALVQLALNPDNTLSVTAGNIIFTSTLSVSDASTWHYYEVDWTLSGGTGTGTIAGTLWVDSLQWGTYTGTAQVPGSNFINGSYTANQVGFGGNCNMMDYYCLDGATTDINGHTTTNTSVWGDVQVLALAPITDVGTGWLTTGGTNTTANSCVNDFVSTSDGTFTNPDDDTSYIYTTATGSAESFNYQSISTFTGTIFGAQYLVCAKKTAEGSREIALTVGTATVATKNFLGTANYLSDYYVYYIAPLDSNNGTAWTVANYDSQTFGVVLTG